MTGSDQVRKAKVLVAGDVMLDRYWFGDVNRISPEAPVPVVRVGHTEERLGGAANVARNIAAIGAHAGLLSVVGADEAADCIQRLLTADGIEAQLHRDPELATTIKLRVIGRQQQLLRIDFETEPGHEVLESKLADFESRLKSTDLVILSDYGKGGLKHIERMIKAALPDARVVIRDLAGDGDHYAAEVTSEAFRGKSRVQQHQLVYQALKGHMGGTLHALALQTGVPD